MRTSIRVAQIGTMVTAAALLAACGSVPLNQPTATYPVSSPVATNPQGMMFGRVTNIEYVQPGAAQAGRNPNILGAVVGAGAGALLGRQIGGGSGRDAATVLGGLGGAAIGSQVGAGQAAPPPATGPSYRVTVATDQGGTRMFEVASYGDLRVGDRVRIENGVIYRM
ncbi:glycine zipper 2TM domain-containing protein [Ramlibacter sp. AW1]|uniref:Glycine zipper 2TM domain-containing protein n=1 Tax=Ramlibacter aurantiacus TaxID=2801330 RepID=A0A936ZLI4_9BURK|nr:glycine zipper 2TM domain-containing protein [Ramlibacter aurantiacus]MBL0419493.1 glycine zipper 2TM domain-containing protein [Ramlibacter aurantiacus]